MDQYDGCAQPHSGAFVHIGLTKLSLCKRIARLKYLLGFKKVNNEDIDLITSKVTLQKEDANPLSSSRVIQYALAQPAPRAASPTHDETPLFQDAALQSVEAAPSPNDGEASHQDTGLVTPQHTGWGVNHPASNRHSFHPETGLFIEDLLTTLRYADTPLTPPQSNVRPRTRTGPGVPTSSADKPATLPASTDKGMPTGRGATSAMQDVGHDAIPAPTHARPQPPTKATTNATAPALVFREKHILVCGHALRGRQPSPCRRNCACGPSRNSSDLRRSKSDGAYSATEKHFQCRTCIREGINANLEAHATSLGIARHEREAVIQSWREGLLDVAIADTKLDRLAKIDDRVAAGLVKLATMRRLEVAAHAESEVHGADGALIAPVGQVQAAESVFSGYRGLDRTRGLVNMRQFGL